ncbi:MAG: lipopolysaccharide biosynthesis protein [Muribaculaceae bacterium]|nr:lipopolysaccharide biosynthesis protein [Muribaculaceae bacterium]
MSQSLKLKTARSIKWNIVDRIGSQILYAVTGIVLARELNQDEFGLVGAALIFQAFGSLLVDSGFSSALIQRKNPTRLDYSSVMWFNLAMSVALYIILWFAAPLIAYCFDNDTRLIPISRVIFLSMIVNALSIVPANRFMKQMNVRPIALANTIALSAGAVVGIYLAIQLQDAWAIVWQTLTVAVIKTLLLWVWARWSPLMRCSLSVLKSFMAVGSAVMLTSFLNTLFLNIYSFFVGNRAGLASLGYYTQGDKWSKMFTASISQILTSSFLPVLSSVQDDKPRFDNMMGKMNRMTAYLSFPILIGLIVMATPIFHALFGVKWDASIILFQLLLARGIFTVMTGLYSNYLLSLGLSKMILWTEIIRDAIALVALLACLPILSDTTPDNPVWGLEIMLWGQIVAAIAAWITTLIAVKRATGRSIGIFIVECVPYLAMCLVIGTAMYLIGYNIPNPWIALPLQGLIGLSVYLIINHLLKSKIQADAIAYIKGKL